jgi:hypothetical protein
MIVYHTGSDGVKRMERARERERGRERERKQEHDAVF